MLYQNGLFIFRRDLRIIDNISLNHLAKNCKNIYTIFIFTPEQITEKNPYKSNNAVQFMLECLTQLREDIEKRGGYLYTFYGENTKMTEYLIKQLKIDCIAYNKDITPYATQRDAQIQKLCEENKCAIESHNDYYLNPPATIFNSSGEAYKKFTPYYNAAIKIKPSSPARDISIPFKRAASDLKHQMPIAQAFAKFVIPNENINSRGGRPEALKYLKAVKTNQKNYGNTRNIVSIATTELSAYIKFGCISIREAYKGFAGNKDLIRQLIWRDFYANILFTFPYVLTGPMKEKYKNIKWHNNPKNFDAWKQGKTGFPIVDAGMRQLNTTGYMHNRCRLIVASFLIKTLLINWQEGEQYFATKLVDYDPASNNLNWQWVASTAVDSQPYFRIFNPWLQQKEYDKECQYIKKWIPELRDVPAKDIHKWYEKYTSYTDIYTAPICDYAKQKDLALGLYK
jgi:deoxyribodipyrimidine photo-lyase